MEDNKQNNTNGTNGANTPQPNTKPIEQPKPAQPEPSIDLLTQKAKEEKLEFGAAGHDDINKNLGSFGNTVVQPQQATPPEVKLDVDAKIVEKASQEKINFERFTKTRRTEKAAKTKFGERVSMMLRSKKGFARTWILEMVGMAIIIAVSITLIACLTKYWGCGGDGPMHLDEVQNPLRVGLVFAWISIFPCAIPLVYLITTWFIGINEVARSRIYHYMFWICLGVSLICFIVGFSCLMIPAHWSLVYPPF